MRIWNNPRGVARPLSDPKAVVSYGINGQGDVSGILYGGKRLEIETKRPKGGMQREAQEHFQAMIEEMGGVYCLARSVDDVIRCLKRHGFERELEESFGIERVRGL